MTSFSQRLKAGWSKDQILKYYVMTEAHYVKVLESLDRIHQGALEVRS